MSGMESPRRMQASGLFMGVLIVLIVAAAIVLAVWAMRLHERERALRGLHAEQNEVVGGQQPPAPVGPQEDVVAGEAPPPPQAEVAPAAPGPEVDYLWIGGWWWWEGHWVWHAGYWAQRPRPGAIWVPHTWERGTRGWVHNGGRWR